MQENFDYATAFYGKGHLGNIEGEKGKQGREWCGNSNECYGSLDAESKKRTLEFIRKNAQAGKPFMVHYWTNFLNFLKPDMPGGKIEGDWGN